MSEEDKFLWLSMGDLKAVNEREILAAQDHALRGGGYETKILKTVTYQMQTMQIIFLCVFMGPCIAIMCQYPTICNYTQFILPLNCSTCFGWFLHPSSGAQISVSTASGISQPLFLRVAIVEESRLLYLL